MYGNSKEEDITELLKLADKWMEKWEIPTRTGILKITIVMEC